jgi:hypothetical protein
LNLIAHQVGESGAKGAIQFAYDDFGFCRGEWGPSRHQCFTCSHDYSFAHNGFSPAGLVKKTPDYLCILSRLQVLLGIIPLCVYLLSY